jgi:hypothetical protein
MTQLRDSFPRPYVEGQTTIVSQAWILNMQDAAIMILEAEQSGKDLPVTKKIDAARDLVSQLEVLGFVGNEKGELTSWAYIKDIGPAHTQYQAIGYAMDIMRERGTLESTLTLSLIKIIAERGPLIANGSVPTVS